MLLSSFVGNNSVKESLLAALASGRLSHGLLLCGEKGTGVNHFAFLLAADIVGRQDTERIEQRQNPLVQTVKGEGASGQIKVDRIRQINNNVNFSAISGDKRVVIIQNCENFNLPSANAMLKNLEEPKDDITYILTTNNPRAILPTIRSRCAVYTLAVPDMARAREYFAGRGMDSRLFDSLRSIYGPNIVKIKAASDEKRRAILQSALDAYECIQARDSYRLSVVCYAYAKNKEGFRLMLDDLRRICHSRLSPVGVHTFDAIQQFSSVLNTNVSLNLAIEAFSIRCIK